MPDAIDVDRAKALLAVGEARRGRLLFTEEVGLQRMHPGEREQRGGVVRGGHERCGRDAQVAALLEEAQELLTDLV